MNSRRAAAFLLASTLLLCSASPAWGQAETEPPPPAVLLIMDSSGSMLASDGTGSTKIAGAKRALTELVDQMPDDAVVGLRVYGHRVPNTDKARGCKDTELIVPVGPLERAVMKERIRSFQATGFTPIGLSLKEAAKDLRAIEGRRTIVLVSDGIDTCAPPPPCLIARRLKQQGIDVRIDTIGFQVNPKARRELRCIARVAGGTYSDARSSGELADRLNASSLRALRTFEVTGTPVVGTPDAVGAPVITSGTYTDVITPEEARWYRVDLAEGQSLSASVTAVTTGQDPAFAEIAGLLAHISPPQGGVLAVGGGQHAVGEPVTARVAMDPVGSDPTLAPGPYHLYLDLRAAEEVGALPIEMVVEVVAGPAAVSPSPSDVASPPPVATPPQEGSGLPLVTLLGSLAAGAVGLVVGIAVTRRIAT